MFAGTNGRPTDLEQLDAANFHGDQGESSYYIRLISLRKKKMAFLPIPETTAGMLTLQHGRRCQESLRVHGRAAVIPQANTLGRILTTAENIQSISTHSRNHPPNTLGMFSPVQSGS
jgi:hypothetical protein